MPLIRDEPFHILALRKFHSLSNSRRKINVPVFTLLALDALNLGIIPTQHCIAKIESGSSPLTDIDIIVIARILNVSIQQLFEDSDKSFSQLGIF
jgi:hypothetical protein